MAEVVSGPSLTAVTALAVLRWACEEDSSDDLDQWVIAAGVGSNLHLYTYNECINLKENGEEEKEAVGKWHWIQEFRVLDGGRRISKVKPYGGNRRKKKLMVIGENTACGLTFVPNKQRGMNRGMDGNQDQWVTDGTFNLGERPHWILDAESLENDSFVASLYADNSLEIWRMCESGTVRRVHRSVCADRCLLTSAAILGSRIDGLSVVAGSMMSTVHCWNPCVPGGTFMREDMKSTVAHVPVQLRLEGHAGAVLRVVCRPFEETRELVIATAAEDRSVRTWIISDWFTACQFSPEMAVRCSTFVGHEGRVYDMVLNSQFVLVSVSEDLSIRVWQAGQPDFQMGKSVASFGHQGKSIWCVEELDENTVVTAGQDGAIHVWHLVRNEAVCSRKLELDYGSCQEDKPAGENFARVLCNAEHAGKYGLVQIASQNLSTLNLASFGGSSDLAGLVMGMDSGSLYWILVSEEPVRNSAISPVKLYHATSPILSVAFEDESCSLFVGLADGRAIFFILRFCDRIPSIISSLIFLAHPSRRITGVFFLKPEPKVCQLAATSDGTGTVKFWKICWNSERTEPASITAIALSQDGRQLAFGDCQGNISVIDNTIGTQAEHSIKTIRRAHGRTVINSIYFESIEGEAFSVKSVAFDSYCREWSIRDLKPLKANRVSEISLLLSWRNKTEKGSESDLAIGLHGGDLVVWNVVQSREITRLPVGGGSRRPIAVLTRGSEYFRVACVCNNLLHITSSKSTSGLTSVVRSPFHGREIHAVFLDMEYCGIFSAGEDGQLRFTSIHPSSKRPQLFESGKKVTDVDSLAPVREIVCVRRSEEDLTNQKIILVVGARLTLQAVNVGLSSNGLVQATRVVLCPRRMLQLALRTKGDQHRILSMSADPFERRVFIVVGTSIGIGMFLSFDTRSHRFQLLGVFNDAPNGHAPIYGPMLSCCMTKLMSNPPQMAWIALAGGTCGSIGIWKMTTDLETDSAEILPMGRINQLLASGVNSANIIYSHGRECYCLAFGGDDGSVGAVHFLVTSGVEEIGRAVIKEAHWASTKSVWTNGRHVISTSGDQVVRLWRISDNAEGDNELEALTKYYLDFAEPAAISIAAVDDSPLNKRTHSSYMIAVGGHGLSLSLVRIP